MRILVRGAGGLAWSGALVALIVALTQLGDPLNPADWRAWATGRNAVEATFALGRIGVLAVAWYLLAATGVGVLATLLRARPLLRVAQLITLPVVRRGLDALLGLSLTAGVLTGPVTGGHVVHAAEAGHGIEAAWEEAPVRLPAESPAHLPELPGAADEVVAAPQTWTVAPGEHFWRIAEAVVGRGGDGSLADQEVARYWTDLIAVNRGVLPDPSNPDLLYPGITLRLPALTR